jgi:hypothetical protein
MFLPLSFRAVRTQAPAKEFLDEYLMAQVTPSMFLRIVRPEQGTHVKSPDLRYNLGILDLIKNQDPENLKLLFEDQLAP